MLLDSQNWIDNRLLIGRPYENKQINYFEELMDKHKPSIFLDIGANIGLYTLYFSKKNYLSKLICFEPVQRNYIQLMTNLMLNNLLKRVESHQLAVSDRSGSQEINIDPLSTGVSRIQIGDRNPSSFTQQEMIQTITLDEFASWQNENIFIKLDVEGHEQSALKGMEDLLQKNKITLQIEVFETPEESASCQLLASIGYKLIHKIDDDLYFTNRSE